MTLLNFSLNDRNGKVAQSGFQAIAPGNGVHRICYKMLCLLFHLLIIVKGFTGSSMSDCWEIRFISARIIISIDCIKPASNFFQNLTNPGSFTYQAKSSWFSSVHRVYKHLWKMQRTSWGEMRQSFYPVEAGLGLNSSAHNNCFLFIHGDRRAQRNTRKRMPHPVAKESMTTRRNFRGIHAIRHGILRRISVRPRLMTTYTTQANF